MKKQKQFYLLLLFLSINSFCQNNEFYDSDKKQLKNEFILEVPKFPTPENDVLFFLSEHYFFNPINYHGKITRLQRNTSQYDNSGNLTHSDTVIYKVQKLYKSINKTLFLDKIGIDSIAKKGKNTFELYHFDEFEKDFFQSYTLINNQILKSIDNTSVSIYKTRYTYNSQNLLFKIETEDDFGNTKIEIATYNVQGQLESKRSYSNADGVTVVIANYVYENLNFIQVNKKETIYFVPLENQKKSLELIDYAAYFDPKTFIILNTVDFKYNTQNQLKEVVEVNKIYSSSTVISSENKRIFELNYLHNKLIVNASLPEKYLYEYTFDYNKNPKGINSFIIEEDKKQLHKKTIFTFFYDEN